MNDAHLESLMDYLSLHSSEILSIDFAWIWDMFTHPKITNILRKLLKIFAWTWVTFNISQKWQCVTKEHLDIFSEMKDNGIKVIFFAWIFSIREEVYKFLSWWDSVKRVFDFVKELKSRWFDTSMELLNNYFSYQEYEKFYEICDVLKCWAMIKNITNYGWVIQDRAGYLFGYNNKAESVDLTLYTKVEWVSTEYLNNSKCWNIPFFTADGYIKTCSNIHGYWTKGVIWTISDIKKFENIEAIFNTSSDFAFGEDCKDCSLCTKTSMDFSWKYYIDNDGKIIRDFALVKVFEIDTADDIIFLYQNDKEFVHEVVTNPEHIHKHEKIDFIQILDLIDRTADLDVDEFWKYMLEFWRMDEVVKEFPSQFSDLESIKDIQHVSDFCKKYEIEPLDIYFLAFIFKLISWEEFLKKLEVFKNIATRQKNATNLAYIAIIVEKIIKWVFSPNFWPSIVTLYYWMFSNNGKK